MVIVIVLAGLYAVFALRNSSASAEVEKPETGYRAYLGEVTLTSPTGQEYKLSTEARVTPDGIRN